jgi:hypothetical protein
MYAVYGVPQSIPDHFWGIATKMVIPETTVAHFFLLS